MNTNLKTRVTASLTNTIGRQVGVLPVDPRPRTTKKAPSSGGKARDFGSGVTGRRTKPLTRTQSLTSTQLDLSDDEDLKDNSSDKSNLRKTSSAKVQSRVNSSPTTRYGAWASRQGSSRQGSSRLGSSRRGSSRPRSQPTEEEEEKDDRPKKTLQPEEILELCQEKDFSKVYEIHLHGEDLTEIADLEKFKKVRVLDLSCNHIRKIDNLDANQDLRELKLYGNEIKTIENLDMLKEVCSLQLQHNKIRSIGRGLSSLKKLKTLRLDSNSLLKLETSDLVGCVQISVLDLSSNMLDNLAALNYLPNLEELYVTNNRLRKVTEIQRCKKLQEVDLSGNRITDLSGLAGLPHLQTLDVSNNQLTSLRSLGKLRCLEELNVSHNQLKEVDCLPLSFPRLQVLHITDNGICDWNQVCKLRGLSDLVEISLSGNPVTLEDGEMPHYHAAIQAVIPHIEIVDGAHVKRQSSKTAPLMRPMSASSIISVRQMDTQLKAYSEEIKSLEKSISDKFLSLRATCESLPATAPVRNSSSLSHSSPHPPASSKPSSRTSSRARLREAMDFVAQNNDIYDSDEL